MKKALPPSILIGVAVASPFSSAYSQKEVDSKKPNIVFILADDLGYGDLGCYGQEKIETPNIDQLAENGLRFTQFYAGAPLSSPSRCSLFTGLHTGHTYIRGNDEMTDRGDVNSHAAMYQDASLEGQRPMPKGTITFPALLQQAGYTTGCIGKWGLGNPGSEGAPENMGFDFFYGYNCQRQAHNYYPPFLYRNDKREYLPNRIYEPGYYSLANNTDKYEIYHYNRFNEGVYSPDLMFNEIKSFVNENKEKPFLLAWTTTIPHMALQAPEKWVKYYLEKFGDEEPYLGDNGYYPSRYPRGVFAAMISTLDEQVGELVKHLKELGIYDNTIIIFTSDNGSANKGGPDPVWFNSGGPFRADKGWGKATLHEGGIRVPLIVTWPGKVKAQATSNHICAGWDFLPTFCDIVDIEPSETDGISILPELLGNKQPEHKYLYWEHSGGKGFKAVRWGKWKGLLENIKKGNTVLKLFDLEADPGETTNLAKKYPKVVKQIEQIMKEAHTEPLVEKFRF